MSMSFPQPQAEHRWLEQLVGDWTATMDEPTDCAPDATGVTWNEHVRSLEGLWVMAEGHGTMAGDTPVTTVMMLGFDPARNCYVGSFVGSMMTHQWVYEGRLSEDGQTLVLDTTGPNMMGDGSPAAFQDIIALDGSGGRTLTSRMRGEDGSWHQVMQVAYRRNG
ncbi:DUF1579 domain-containing protein [Mangrovicella endophytica]|uniref:DUF1579 domain-containing protein n=1 Tax=Mangrovicella endophytica TaxID=2066697 RepID=UPI001FE03B85|nr:DUF1579 domain-containing protein [Mangrovicella endophytica]